MFIAEATLNQLYKIQDLIDHAFDLFNRSSVEICAAVRRHTESGAAGATAGSVVDEPDTCTGLSMKSLLLELSLYSGFFDRE